MVSYDISAKYTIQNVKTTEDAGYGEIPLSKDRLEAESPREIVAHIRDLLEDAASLVGLHPVEKIKDPANWYAADDHVTEGNSNKSLFSLLCNGNYVRGDRLDRMFWISDADKTKMRELLRAGRDDEVDDTINEFEILIVFRPRYDSPTLRAADFAGVIQEAV